MQRTPVLLAKSGRIRKPQNGLVEGCEARRFQYLVDQAFCDSVVPVFQDGCLGYGKQETGGYSIQIEDLSLWENAIHLQTVLIGPKDGEELKEEPSYPCLVVKMKYREEPVIFE